MVHMDRGFEGVTQGMSSLWLASRRLVRWCVCCASEAEGPVGVEKASRILQVHVVASRAGLAVPTLEKKDFLSDPGGDSRCEAAFSGGDAGEAANIGATSPEDTAQSVAKHLVGDRGCRKGPGDNVARS